MARYVDVIDLPVPPDVAFEELADFSRTEHWDPGVAEASRLDSAPVGVGSRFEVHVAFLGQSRRLEYAIDEFDPPHRVVLVGGDASLHLVDEITFTPRDGGTRVAYEVRCEPIGLLRVLDPLLALVLPRIGSAAAEGLRAHGERLAARSPVSPAPATTQRSIPIHPSVEAREAGRAHQEGVHP